MNEVKLTQNEAELLLASLKQKVQEFISFPYRGRKTNFEVKEKYGNNIFNICIYRGKINAYKYNINAFLQKNGIILLSLDINPNARHPNPPRGNYSFPYYGVTIEGPHWHIYTEEFGRKLAFPAENINSKQFVENTILFLKKFNVIDLPQINEQIELI